MQEVGSLQSDNQLPDEAKHLPPLGEGEHYVFEYYASGFKRTVVERDNNILSIDEARQQSAAVSKAMLEELQRYRSADR